MADANLQRASRLETATISDALDKLRIPGQCLGIKPRDHAFRMAGRAHTVLYGPMDTADPGNVATSSTISSPAPSRSSTTVGARMPPCGATS